MQHKKVKWPLMVLGIFLLIVAMSAYFLLLHTIRYYIYQSLILSESAERYPDWVEIKGDQSVEVYFWNVSNSEQVHKDPKIAPIFNQVGPFTYRARRIKENITFDQNSSTVSYKEQVHLKFDIERSIAGEDQLLTVINFPVLSIFAYTKSLPSQIAHFVNVIVEYFENSGKTGIAFMQRNISELVMGYNDPFLAKIKSIPIIGDQTDDRVGIFADKSRLVNDFVVYTGAPTEGNPVPQQILEWNGMRSIPYFGGNPYCGAINGTDGTLFSLTRYHQHVQVFVPDLCRSVELEYETSVVHKSVNLRRYRLSNRTQANITINPDNACFDKLGAALFDLRSGCIMKVPLVASNPHFLNANPKYADQVRGMKPDFNHHLTRLDIEPETGYPLLVSKLLQLNFYSAGDSREVFREDMLYPLAWMNQSFRVCDSDVQTIKSRIQRPMMGSRYGSLAVLCCGVTLLAVGLLIMFIDAVQCWRSSTDEDDSGDTDSVAAMRETTPLLHNEVV